MDQRWVPSKKLVQLRSTTTFCWSTMERLGARVTGGENFQELGLRTSHFFHNQASLIQKNPSIWKKQQATCNLVIQTKQPAGFLAFFLARARLVSTIPCSFQVGFFFPTTYKFMPKMSIISRHPCRSWEWTFGSYGPALSRNVSCESREKLQTCNGRFITVLLAPGARVRPSTNNWVSYQPTIGYLTNYQPTIGYLTNQLLGILPTIYWLGILPPTTIKQQAN